MRRWLCVAFALLVCGFAAAQGRAGTCADLKEIVETGIDRYFTAEEISDEIFARIDGRSFKRGGRIRREELRYVRVLHHTPSGEVHYGELICNRLIARDLVEIFRALYDEKYPIERMVLIDEYDAQDKSSMEANNTSAFNYREIRNTGKLSNHSYGMAVDVNPLYNPCVIRRKNGTLSVDPEKGRPYADRTKTFPMKITREDACYREFVKHGFEWGGAWHSLKDYQHFEKKL